MTFNLYDMLVFEDENRIIHQDCVKEIERRLIEVDCTDEGNDYYFTDIICNNLVLTLDECGQIFDIFLDEDTWYNVSHHLKLKEIWSREDEDTYRRVWRR